MSTQPDTTERSAVAPRPPEIVLGVLLVALSGFFLLFTFSLSTAAAAWPRIVLALLAVLGVAIAIRGARPKADEAPATAEDARGGEWSLQRLRRPLETLGIVVAYVALIPILGFFPATLLFLVFHLWYGGVRDLRVIGGVVVAFPLFVYLLFVMQLSLPLPPGILFE